MNRWLRVLSLMLGLVCGLTNASADESFLGKPFKPTPLEAKTYQEEIQELSRIIGKRVLIPDGVTEFVTEINSWNISFQVPVWMRIGRANEMPTLREALDQTTLSMGMKWTYDPPKDRVVLDFEWRRSDARSGPELVHILETTPTFISPLDQRYFWDHHSLPSDATWQIAFDALLSKTGDSSKVWKIRLADDLKRSCVPLPAINLLSAQIKDSSGNPHLLILNDQPLMVSPGEGSFSYYVFDLSGKFEQGGIFHSGWRCENASAWIAPNENGLTFRVFFNESGKMDEHFVLTDKGLVLHDVLDYQSGSTSAADDWRAKEMHMGVSPFYTTN